MSNKVNKTIQNKYKENSSKEHHNQMVEMIKKKILKKQPEKRDTLQRNKDKNYSIFLIIKYSSP